MSSDTRAAFEACPADSIDYAVMEKTDAAAVLPINVGWNDVGSWSALWEIADQDPDGNAHHGDVIALGCRNTLAWGGRRLVSLLGLQDVIVVDTDDALLVAVMRANGLTHLASHDANFDRVPGLTLVRVGTPGLPLPEGVVDTRYRLRDGTLQEPQA